ncbi:pyridoxamine 5'-phosphate oxidase family protein [Kitasatospora sp. NBC_00240]|uniref:pyridoxine/pyridoxamine 5'-phosphate oxidase n=1 Tax=Kitasatospora sp. NBC_00240 TaxID=2903567 RepID=UPI002259B468|nr:pyridoxamine 5'-phosphate oxidase family protein [Kitasatospora sp. NBC_00240]MCX5211902.1 pyridoxamine 5'-phosphate oxidase family protein [Kitasatospora sp. NBC_00240]
MVTDSVNAPRPAGPGRSAVAGLLFGRPPMARALPFFDPERAPDAPGPLFADWLAGAFTAGVLDPQVVTLSTIGADGVPDARALVLRDVDADGGAWVFAIDADSPKGRQLAAHPVAAMTLYWPAQGRQVRVRGTVEAASREVSAAEFATRSPGARAAVLVGRQSEPLASLGEYDLAADEAGRRLELDPAVDAPTHTVYTLRAREVEFWQGDQSRRHVRLRYDRPAAAAGGDAPAGWERTLLWP